jgi:hypothetical protein
LGTTAKAEATGPEPADAEPTTSEAVVVPDADFRFRLNGR